MTSQTQNKQIPKGWKEESLFEIGEIITGNTPPKKFKDYYDNGTIEFIKPSDLQNKEITTFNEKISNSAKNIARLIHEDGVLVTCIGEIGRVGFVKKEIAFNQQINGIQPNNKIAGKFLFYRLQIEKKQMENMASATTVPIVNKSKFEKTKITYPESKEEQAFIVQEIEKQFTRLDAAVKSLKAVKQKLESYRKAVLKKTFEKNSDYGNFEEYVEILDSKRKPVNSTERATRTGNIPYYGATGQVGWIDDYLFDEELVLLGEDGAPFLDTFRNKAYLIKGKSWVNNHAHVLKGKNGLNNKILFYWLNNIDYYSYVMGTTRLKLNQSRMKTIKIPKLSVFEQSQIVQEIESKFSVIDKIEQVVNESLGKSEKLRKSILKSAFEGKLVKMEEVEE